MKRRLLILAAVTAAEGIAVTACFLWALHRIDVTAGEIEKEYTR